MLYSIQSACFSSQPVTPRPRQRVLWLNLDVLLTIDHTAFRLLSSVAELLGLRLGQRDSNHTLLDVHHSRFLYSNQCPIDMDA